MDQSGSPLLLIAVNGPRAWGFSCKCYVRLLDPFVAAKVVLRFPQHFLMDFRGT
jgi:hypothetical protein